MRRGVLGDMFPLRVLFGWLLLFATAFPIYADHAESAYKAGAKAEKSSNYDVALEEYKKAYTAKPTDAKYMAAYTRARFYASAQHIHNGQLLRDAGKLQEALADFRLAAQIDPTNFAALQEVRRTADLILKQETVKNIPAQAKAHASIIEQMAKDAAGPVQLDLAQGSPVTLHLTTTTDLIYKTIGRLAGINVLMDPDYKPQKLNVELKDVSLREALAMVALQSKTFWRAVSPNTIIVSSDTAGKRKEIEGNVMETFYLRNAATPNELQEAAGTLKGILDINRIQVSPEQRSLTLRGTSDQIVLAKKLLEDIDKPRPEVLIELVVMQVSRDKLHTIGVNPPTSANIWMGGSGSATDSSSSSGSSSGSSGSGSGSGSNTFVLNTLAYLNATNFFVSIPGASLSFLMTDSNTKVLQRPEIRAMDSEKGSLKIGDRIPIATGSFQGGVSPLVNTQFQYLDVGVNVDITPYVHSEKEVTLKMSLEISSVTGVQNIGGINQPTIGQRRIEHEARLVDGEVNLIGGILQDTETHSLSGYPFLTRIPILKYLFGQENKEHQQSEIVFAITPHILRSNEITDDNIRMVDIGTGNSIIYRQKDSQKEPTKASSAPVLGPPVQPPTGGTPAPATSTGSGPL
jgi:general secretion pathway protein D